MILQTIKQWSSLVCVLLLAVLSAGCLSNTEPEFRQLPPESELVRTRAAEVAALWGRDGTRSVLFREQDFAYYRNDLARLTARLTALKVNHAYLTVESLEILKDSDKREDLLAAVTAFAGAGIASDIVLPQYLFPVRRPATVFHRAFSSKAPFEEAMEYALRFKRYLPEHIPGPGVTVWAGIHRFTKDNEQLPSGAVYRWSESNYGAGSDNDAMMKQFLRDLAGWRRAVRAERVRFSAAIPVFYHNKAKSGELTKGLVKDFLAVTDSVLVIGYGEKPSEYLRSLQEVLREDTAGRIRCGMVLSGHMSESVGALRRRSWQDFFKILTVMHRSCGQMPGYGGMVLIPWQSVELLQER